MVVPWVAKRQGVGLAIQGSWVRVPAVTLLRNNLRKLFTPHCLIHAILHEEDCELLIKSKSNRMAAVEGGNSVDPSATPPPVFRLARTKSGWRASVPTKIRLAVAGDLSGGGGSGRIRRDLVEGGISHY